MSTVLCEVLPAFQPITTTTLTQDFVVPGFGTPKLVQIWCANGLTDGVNQPNVKGSIGSYDGVRNQSIGWSTGANGTGDVTLQNASRCMSDQDCFIIPNNGGTDSVCRATGSFITDGFRLTWAANNTSRAFFVVLWGGDGILSATCSTVKLTGTTPIAETLPGAAVNALHMYSIGANAVPAPFYNTDTSVVEGWATKTPFVQMGHTRSAQANVTPPNTSAYFSTDTIGPRLNTSNAVAWEAEIQSFDATGFTTAVKAGGAASTAYMFYDAFEFAPDVQVDINSGVFTPGDTEVTVNTGAPADCAFSWVRGDTEVPALESITTGPAYAQYNAIVTGRRRRGGNGDGARSTVYAWNEWNQGLANPKVVGAQMRNSGGQQNTRYSDATAGPTILWQQGNGDVRAQILTPFASNSAWISVHVQSKTQNKFYRKQDTELFEIYKGTTPMYQMQRGEGRVWPPEAYVVPPPPVEPTLNYDQLVASLGATHYYKCAEASGNLVAETAGSPVLVENEGPQNYGQASMFGFTDTTVRCNNNTNAGWVSNVGNLSANNDTRSFSGMFLIPPGNSFDFTIAGLRATGGTIAGTSYGGFVGNNTNPMNPYMYTNTVGHSVTSSAVAGEGTAVHFVCVVVRQDFTVWYLNNIRVEDNSVMNANLNLNGTYDVYLGGAVTGSTPIPLRGNMGRVAFYDFALTQEQAQELWYALPANGGPTP